jgi:hypothetical protein
MAVIAGHSDLVARVSFVAEVQGLGFGAVEHAGQSGPSGGERGCEAQHENE